MAANDSWLSLLGFDRAQAIGMPLGVLLSGPGGGLITPALEHVAESQSAVAVRTLVHRARSGETKPTAPSRPSVLTRLALPSVDAYSSMTCATPNRARNLAHTSGRRPLPTKRRTECARSCADGGACSR